MRRWQQLVVTALWWIGIPLLTLSLIEGTASAWLAYRFVRSVPVDTNFRKAQYDSLIGWVGLPGLALPDMFGPGLSLTNNADGMRIHRPVVPALRPGATRILCSGDSFAHGWGVRDGDTFCAALEPLLPGVETLNMAQPGYGIDQAYLWYKRDGARYPHQVHLFTFIWNDFERMTMRSFWGYSKPVLRLARGALAVDNVPVPAWTGSSRGTVIARNLPPRLRLVRLVQRQFDNSDSAQLARAEALIWDVAEATFRDLDRLNRERGSQLVLVYLPTISDLEAGAYDARRARLAAFAARAGIVLVDLSMPMRAEPVDSAPWFFLTAHQLKVAGTSGHYSPRGHGWVARQLAARLAAMPALQRVAAGPAKGAR